MPRPSLFHNCGSRNIKPPALHKIHFQLVGFIGKAVMPVTFLAVDWAGREGTAVLHHCSKCQLESKLSDRSFSPLQSVHTNNIHREPSFNAVKFEVKQYNLKRVAGLLPGRSNFMR